MAASDATDALFRRYRRDAVLLHRPWPPHAGPPTNSRFGGLPNLPGRYAWPRTSNGTPLHFLAQVDCADVRFRTPLPDRGVLFFFGRDDEEQIWNERPPASDDCRVLYALDAFALTPPRQPPADLPPITGDAGSGAFYHHRVGREKGPNVHTAWPIVPLRFDSFPDASALPERFEWSLGFFRDLLRSVPGARDAVKRDREMRDAYDARLKARRVAAFEAATGVLPPQRDPTPLNYDTRAGEAILGFAASGPDSFPQHWAYVHSLARAILHRPTSFTYGNEAEGERLATEAERWLARSREVPLDRPVAEDDRQALRAWLVTLKSTHDPSEMGYRAAQLAFLAAVATIRAWAGDPTLAALVPAHVYAACEAYFSNYTTSGVYFSQMLGHAPSAQQALPADDPTICLLNLESDSAVGWSFGDDGQCAFWIAPRDLARRDFSKVEGTIVGH
jgi:Domain of unknown function (DUF1963)